MNYKMQTYRGITSEQYGKYLIEIVAEACADEPDRYADARSFADLHDVCDANEFLIEADEHFNIDIDATHTDWEQMESMVDEALVTLNIWMAER